MEVSLFPSRADLFFVWFNLCKTKESNIFTFSYVIFTIYKFMIFNHFYCHILTWFIYIVIVVNRVIAFQNKITKLGYRLYECVYVVTAYT